METFVALLRAVNVGGTGKLPMSELRSMAEETGLTDVQTYIQSGNLIFSSTDKPSDIKMALEQRLQEYAGKPVSVVLRSAKEIQDVLDANPFRKAEPSKVGVLFLDSAPPADTKIAVKGRADEQIELGDREVFVYYPSGMGRTKLRFAEMSNGTVRNINTVAKLAKMAADT
jgi:uncharacterized protein (DUF1697 family)